MIHSKKPQDAITSHRQKKIMNMLSHQLHKSKTIGSVDTTCAQLKHQQQC